MSFFDSELSEKATQWKIPLEIPRSIKGKISLFKAHPGLLAVGLVFIPSGLIVGILFLSLGMFNDLIINDWAKAIAQPQKWVNSTGERINGKYIPGIKVKYSTDENTTEVATVKITNLDKVEHYLQAYEDGDPIFIEYSKTKPDVARIFGMKSTAMPAFFVFFPFIFIAVGILLFLMTIRVRNRLVNVLENGTFTVGKITKISYQRNNRKSKYSTNKSFFVSYEYAVDGEIITGKTGVYQKIEDELVEGTEIPLIYSVFGYKYKAYSPLFLKIEFD